MKNIKKIILLLIPLFLVGCGNAEKTKPEVNQLISYLEKIPGAVRFGEGVKLDKEGFIITANLSNSKKVGKYHMAVVSFKISHENLLPESVSDFAVGINDDEDAAIQHAFGIWLVGGLTVLKHLHTSACDCGVVEEMVMTSLTENREPIVWKVLRGPLMGMGIESEKAPEGSVDNNSMVEALMDAITGQLHQRKKIWIRGIVTRVEDEISGECYLNNRHWQEGLDALTIWAKSWGTCEGIQTRRQFMICVPTDKKPTKEAMEQIRKNLASRKRE